MYICGEVIGSKLNKFEEFKPNGKYFLNGDPWEPKEEFKIKH